MKKLIAIILLTLTLLTSCSKPDMTIKNATLIDTSEVNKISTLIDDKLVAFKNVGGALFEQQILNSDASGYHIVSQYHTELGYIDCNDNSFTKVSEVVPIADIGVTASVDNRYIYYTYNKFPENTPYPETQEEHSNLLYNTPTTVLRYDTKTGEKKEFEAPSYVGRIYPMENGNVLIDSFYYSSNSLPEKEYITFLDFENDSSKILYNPKNAEEFQGLRLKSGQRYIFLYSLYKADNMPFIRIIDTHDFSEKIIYIANEIAEMEVPYIDVKDDTIFLFDYTYGDFEPVYKLSPENEFAITVSKKSEIEDFFSYVCNSVGNEPGEKRGKYFETGNYMTETQILLDIGINDFIPPFLGHGSTLYPTTGENYILYSGNSEVWDFYPVFNLQTDFKFYYVEGEEISRAMGK